MKKIGILVLTCITFFSCDPSGVKQTKSDTGLNEQNQSNKDTVRNELDADLKVLDEKSFADGLRIKWLKHGQGNLLKDGDMINIEYKVSLETGEVIEGTHLMPDPYVPFMVGYGMQTTGWDLALKQMKVGDHAEVFIPSKLGRGDKGIDGLVPENSNLFLRIRILEIRKPDRVVDGNKVWIFKDNKANKVKFDEQNTIEFHAMAFTKTNPLFVNTFKTGKTFTLRLEDQGLVPGLKKALINAKKADHMFVLVPASEAYKSKGYLDLVKPDEDLLYNILVMDVREK